jgi:hypothetical protein
MTQQQQQQQRLQLRLGSWAKGGFGEGAECFCAGILPCRGPSRIVGPTGRLWELDAHGSVLQFAVGHCTADMVQCGRLCVHAGNATDLQQALGLPAHPRQHLAGVLDAHLRGHPERVRPRGVAHAEGLRVLRPCTARAGSVRRPEGWRGRKHVAYEHHASSLDAFRPPVSRCVPSCSSDGTVLQPAMTAVLSLSLWCQL